MTTTEALALMEPKDRPAMIAMLWQVERRIESKIEERSEATMRMLAGVFESMRSEIRGDLLVMSDSVTEIRDLLVAGESRKRVPATEEVKTLLLTFYIQKRNGRCPLDGTRIIDEFGAKLPDAQFDHIDDRRNNGAADNFWILCVGCNQTGKYENRDRTIAAELAFRGEFEAFVRASHPQQTTLLELFGKKQPRR